MRTLQEHSLRESDFWTLAVRRRRGGGSLRALLPNNFERPSRNQIKTYPAVPGDRLGRVADAFVNSFASTLTGRKYRSTDSWISFLTTSRNRPDSEALFLDVRWGRVPADLLDMAASLFQTQRHFLQEFPNFHKNKEHETDHIRQKQQNFDYVAPKYNLIWRPESLDPMCSERNDCRNAGKNTEKNSADDYLKDEMADDFECLGHGSSAIDGELCTPEVVNPQTVA
jgi:hypothetical protein